MSQEIYLLYPEGKSSTCPMNLKFVTDLKLNTIFNEETNTRFGIPLRDFKELFTRDEEVCQYRLEIMEDLLDQPKIDALFTQALPEIEAIYELRKAKTEQENVEANLHSLKEIETYIKLMDYLGSEMKAIHPKSKGLQWLWNQVMVVYESEEYQHLKENSGKMMDSIGGIKSITLGVNLDTSRMVAKEIGVLSIQGESYHSGDLIDS